jgi:hypothetical protein
MKMLHEHNFVIVLHPNWIMELDMGHALHTTLLKSLFRHVSAAVHANEFIPGSDPAQHLVASGMEVTTVGLFLNVILQSMGRLLSHVSDSRTDVLAFSMSSYR